MSFARGLIKGLPPVFTHPHMLGCGLKCQDAGIKNPDLKTLDLEQCAPGGGPA